MTAIGSIVTHGKIEFCPRKGIWIRPEERRKTRDEPDGWPFSSRMFAQILSSVASVPVLLLAPATTSTPTNDALSGEH